MSDPGIDGSMGTIPAECVGNCRSRWNVWLEHTVGRQEKGLGGTTFRLIVSGRQ
jgi:hypothetical protein